MGIPTELGDVRNVSPHGINAAQTDIASVGPDDISNEAGWADLMLALIFRKGRYKDEFPRGKSTGKIISDFCRRHLISTTVMSALPNSALPDVTIATLTEWMSDSFEQQKALYRQLAAAITEIQPALDREGISWRLMKGPRLQEAYYGGLARGYFDLDILVPKTQFLRASRVLARLGWRTRKRGFIPLMLVQRFEHGLGMQRGEAIVDLHWSLRVHPAYRISEDRVFASMHKSHYAGIEVPVLDPEYDLTLCLLSIAHGIERGRAVLRDAIDLYVILRAVDATISWRSFFYERERERIERICVSLLAAAVSWLDDENTLPHLRSELRDREYFSTKVNPLKSCICLENAKGAGRRWYLQLYGGWRGYYWLHTAMSVVVNQEFPYNLPRTSFFRRFMR